VTPELERLEKLFSEALALPLSERDVLLRRACGADARLRARIEGLLAAAESTGGFLETPPALLPELDADRRFAADLTGQRVGDYVIVRRLAEGGAGVVYEAEQQEPVRRRVALKVMKPGTDTEAAIARFEAERQALALMEHPNIAQVFDAGAAEDGRLYFAMELVRGERITDYCDRHRLGTTERLRLFVQVCRAVQHAHQKGVIHRDLKPSNILVSCPEGEPPTAGVPKVIDFGIAKAVQGLLSDATQLTKLEQIIGTPAYMSPEQAVFGARDIDTRTDVYSLGVLLYELLTGRTPFDTQELLQAGLSAVQQAICEREPPRPSIRLATTGEGELAGIAAVRAAEGRSLVRSLEGDLDWIVLKALEKDPGRRYATAHELASDLERHLRDEPVLARPPSAVYRLRKLARRHRLSVLSTLAVAIVLVVGTAISTTLAVRARRAEREARRSVEVFHQVLGSLGDSMAFGPAGRTEGEWNSILDDAVRRVAAQTGEDPAIRGEMEHLFGKIYMAADRATVAEGMLRSAVALRRQKLGENHPDTLQARFDLAVCLYMAGRGAEGEAETRCVLAARRDVLGNEHPDSVKALEFLAFGIWLTGDAVQAEPLFREAIEIRTRTGRLRVFDNGLFTPLQGLAQCLLTLGRMPEGESYARVNLEAVVASRLPSERRHIHAYLTLRWALGGQGRHKEALEYSRAALEVSRSVLGSGHREMTDSLDAVTYDLMAVGGAENLVEAERLCRESLETWQQSGGRGENGSLWRIPNLAVILTKQNRVNEALAAIEEAWEIGSQTRTSNHAFLLSRVVIAGVWISGRSMSADGQPSSASATWEKRMADFEQRVRDAPPGPWRTNAVRGFESGHAEWAAMDRTWPDRSADWRELLVICEQQDASASPEMARPK
jgi:eukaryotic-like serine/threonine-protein kinase